jgi:hypothetical protein
MKVLGNGRRDRIRSGRIGESKNKGSSFLLTLSYRPTLCCAGIVALRVAFLYPQVPGPDLVVSLCPYLWAFLAACLYTCNLFFWYPTNIDHVDDVTCSSETSVWTGKSTRRYSPKDHNLNS